MKKLIGLCLVVFFGLSLVGCGDSGSSSGNPSSSEAAESSSASSQKTAAGFDSEDISDEAINSIETYEDYLDKYYKILDIFLTEHQAVFKDAGMDTDATFDTLRDVYNQDYEQQKEEYASRGNETLGSSKESFISTLTRFRDNAEEALNKAKAAN